ncbi:hypothetical protein [Synechococcus phage S-B28]|jgi:hypothetical protein|uniref:Uncharacterized protein n=1 Tax=Synechococcus phage S-B28 TaxID=2545435 RepID=A0A482IC86_9CAUD|nr:hypothetical protein HOV28_gp24 [Synechococcus phage S-B28]QBP05819.1 hypothetical protein [Synechococcus phage S-B28]
MEMLMKNKKVDQKAFDSNFVSSAPSYEIGPGHRGAMKGKKIYDKGKGTTNPNEKDTFMKRTGPQLPLVKRKGKTSYG